MSGIFARLIRQSGLYALLAMGVKASGLIILPLYVNLLPTAAFGQFELLDTTARFAILIADLGVASGLLRFMTTKEHEAWRPALPFTALVTAGAASAVLLGACWAFAPALSRLLLADPAAAPLVRLTALYAGFKVLSYIPLMVLRTQERVGWYVTATLAEVAVLVVAVLVLLVRLERGLLGVMEAYAVSAGAAAVVLVGVLLARVPWRFDLAILRPLMRFGVPMVLAALAAQFMNLGDRYLLAAFTDVETVGVYGWAARLAGVLNMLFVSSFQLAFGVLGLKVLAEAEDRVSIYRRTFRHYVIWTGWSVLGLSLLAYDFTALVARKEMYLAGEPYVLPLALGFLGYGVYYIMSNVLFRSGQTAAIAWMVFAAALVNAALNAVLIPVFGGLGAALATAVAYFALALLCARAGHRQLAVDYAWGKLAVVVALVVGLYLVARPTVGWPVVPRLALRVGLILAYLPLVLATRLYTFDEVRQGIDLLRGKLKARKSRGREGAGGAVS